MPGLAAVLEERGYTVLFAIGQGQRPDGSYSIQVAAHPVIRELSEETWQVTRGIIVATIDKIRDSVADDLNWVRP